MSFCFICSPLPANADSTAVQQSEPLPLESETPRATSAPLPSTSATLSTPEVATTVSSLEGNGSVLFLSKADPILRQAVLLSLSTNPKLRSAAARLNKAGIEVDIERNGYYPSVQTAIGSNSLQRLQLSYDVSVTQMLYDWGAVESRIASATAAQTLSMQELLVTREDAALDVVELYFDILFGKQKIAASDEAIERLKALEALSQRRLDGAYSDSTEKTRVLLEIAKAQDLLLQQQTQVQEALQQFQLLVGNMVVTDIDYSPISLKALLDRGQKLQALVTASPLYQQAVAKKNRQEADLRNASAMLKPQLNLEGGLQRREIGRSMTNDTRIGVQLRLPLMQGMSNFQRLDALRESVSASEWDMASVEQDIRRKVLTLMESEAPFQGRVQALSAQITNGLELVDVYRQQFAIGMRSMSDLLTTELGLAEAQRQLIQVRSEQQRLTYRATAQLGLLVPLLEDRLSEKMGI